MHWTEPTTWKRVKDNAREIARVCRWRRIGAFSGALALAICLCVRVLLPESADFLTAPRMIGIIAAVTLCPLVVFLGALQTGSVSFRRKSIDVSDSFVHYFITYGQIVSLGFERFEGKSYFYVRGVPLRGEKEVEVHVALTAKYTESDIETYIVLKGLGHLLAATRAVNALPIRTKAPKVQFESQKVVLASFLFLSWLVVVPSVLFGMIDMHSWFAVAIALAFLADIRVWIWLLGKGAGRRVDNLDTLADGLSLRRVWALGFPYMLTIVLNPAIVLAVLRWAALTPVAVWMTAAFWQIVWMAFVYGVGRLFRQNPQQNPRT